MLRNMQHELIGVDDILEGLGLAFNAILLGVICRRSRWRQYPILTVFGVYALVQESVLNVAFRLVSTHVYRWFYWSFAITDYSLQIALIWEIARSVFRPRKEWIQSAVRIFVMWSILGCIAVGFFVIVTVPATNDLEELYYQRLSLLSSLITCVFLFVFSTVANRFGLPRRDHARAVAQGIAVWNVVSIVGDVLLANGCSAKESTMLDVARMLAWDLVLCYWSVVLWFPEREKKAWVFPGHSDLGSL